MKKIIFALIFLSSNLLFSVEYSEEIIPQEINFFIKNIGQFSPEILYYSDITSGKIFIRSKDIVLQFLEEDNLDEQIQLKISNVYIIFPFSNFSNVIAEEELETKINYIKGNDPNKWYFKIPTFKNVTIKNIYEGIDLVVGGENFWHFEGNAFLQKEPIYNSSGKILKKENGYLLSFSFGNFLIPEPKK